jgi:hypothetical protein
MNSESYARLAAIASRWNDVERRIKQIEMLRREAVLATVNELRYTGRKIADALVLMAEGKEAADAEVERELIIAENYLTNADHDLTDSAIMFVDLRIQRTSQFHRKKKILRCIPKFSEAEALLKDAKTIVAESRANRQDRQKVYQRLASDHVPKLIQFHEELTSHPELSIPDGPIQRRLQITTIFAFIAMVAAVVTAAVHVWTWHSAPSPLTLDQVKQAVVEALKESNR